jgi:hypothetical protein
MEHEEHPKKSGGWETFSGRAFIIFLVVLGFRAIDWSFIKGEIVEYPMMCKTKVNLGNCSQPEVPLNRTTYKPNTSRQEVLYWSEATGDVQKLTKCAVRDRKNWSCKYDDESAEFGFTNGNYWSYSNSEMNSAVSLEMNEKMYYLSRWGWMNERCKIDTSPRMLCVAVEIIFN